ncbi:MAG: hypothetical protein R2712_11435 [Vicinamibacterales bacterium]
MDDGGAGHGAIAGIGDLGLDACAVVARVRVIAERDAQLELSVGIEPRVSLRGLVVLNAQ